VEGNCYGIWSHGFLDACMDGWIEKLWGDIVFMPLHPPRWRLEQ
jgi:hypothetical protein